MSHNDIDAMKSELFDFVSSKRERLSSLALSLKSFNNASLPRELVSTEPVVHATSQEKLPATVDRIPLAIDTSPASDPMARLNAIKLRLSKQIEGS